MANKKDMFTYDFLVIGSGIAGLSFALKASRYGTVCIITKKYANDSNTRYAQGGIACVSAPTDSSELHIKDTLYAGAGHCNEEAVRIMVEEAPNCINDLLSLGIRFSRSENGMDLGLEGGHSQRRIIHSHDFTGREIEETLLHAIHRQPDITIYEQNMAIDLVVSDNQCLGASVLDEVSGEIRIFKAGFTLLCTGGCGQVYLHTTNPTIATGDGVAMAYRAGVQIVDMEFVQFHPTTLYHPNASSFLISEALRGAGAFLCNANGQSFMEYYHTMGSLAPRDVVCRAIVNEMNTHNTQCVYLDARHISLNKLQNEFPQIYDTCMSIGIDISTNLIPVTPSAHYMCGGVKTDLNACSSIANLYATGETGCTGVHGANRLASNSLLEALVFSNRALKHIMTNVSEESDIDDLLFLSYDHNDSPLPDENILHGMREELRRLMWEYTGVVRDLDQMQSIIPNLLDLNNSAEYIFNHFRKTTESIELYNMTGIALLIVQSATEREESCGLHYLINA